MPRRFRPKKNVVIGIDIAKAYADLYCLGSQERPRFEIAALAALVAWVVELRPRLVVMEASGGYEAPVWEALEQAGVAVAVVNPRAVRDFARAHGQHAKNDRIDAEMLALFGKKIEPSVTPRVANPAVRELMTRRAALTEQSVAEQNRLKQAKTTWVRSNIASSLEFIRRQIAEVEAEIGNALESSAVDVQRLAILESAPGIGRTTAATLVVLLPELGKLCRRKIAKLVGLAPFTRESGTWKGKRFIGYGRSLVRTSLYMPTLVAIRHNPVIRHYYKRLVAAGKPKMVAVTACMRKLLTILNAAMRDSKPWALPKAAAA